MGAYPSTTSPRLICEGWVELVTFSIVGSKTQRAYVILDEQDFTVLDERDTKSPRFKLPSGKTDVRLVDVNPPKFHISNGFVSFQIIPDFASFEYHQSSAFSKVGDHELFDTPLDNVMESISSGIRDANETTVMSSTPSGGFFSLSPRRKLGTVPTDTLSSHSGFSLSSSESGTFPLFQERNEQTADFPSSTHPVSSLTSMLAASQTVEDYTNFPNEDSIIYSSPSPSPTPKLAGSPGRLSAADLNALVLQPSGSQGSSCYAGNAHRLSATGGSEHGDMTFCHPVSQLEFSLTRTGSAVISDSSSEGRRKQKSRSHRGRVPSTTDESTGGAYFSLGSSGGFSGKQRQESAKHERLSRDTLDRLSRQYAAEVSPTLSSASYNAASENATVGYVQRNERGANVAHRQPTEKKWDAGALFPEERTSGLFESSEREHDDADVAVPPSPTARAFLSLFFQSSKHNGHGDTAPEAKEAKERHVLKESEREQLELLSSIRDYELKKNVLQLRRSFEEARYHTIVRQTIAHSRKAGYKIRRDALSFDKHVDRLFVKGSGIFRGTLLGRFEVAVKVLPNASVMESLPDDFVEEMKNFEHKYITRFFGYCTDSQFVYELSELVEAGSVVNFVKHGCPPSEHQLFRIISNISSAMEHLHRHGILHRDLSPYCIYVFDWARGEVKLGGFGPVRRFVEDSVPGSVVAANMIYASPEVLHDGYTPATDMYSFAMTLCYIATGTPPAETVAQAYEYWDTNTRPSLSGVARWARELISLAWARDPEARPTFAEVREFLGQLRDWQNKWVRMVLAQVVVGQRKNREQESSTPAEESDLPPTQLFPFFPFFTSKKSKKRREDDADETEKEEKKASWTLQQERAPQAQEAFISEHDAKTEDRRTLPRDSGGLSKSSTNIGGSLPFRWFKRILADDRPTEETNGGGEKASERTEKADDDFQSAQSTFYGERGRHSESSAFSLFGRRALFDAEGDSGSESGASQEGEDAKPSFPDQLFQSLFRTKSKQKEKAKLKASANSAAESARKNDRSVRRAKGQRAPTSQSNVLHARLGHEAELSGVTREEAPTDEACALRESDQHDTVAHRDTVACPSAEKHTNSNGSDNNGNNNGEKGRDVSAGAAAPSEAGDAEPRTRHDEPVLLPPCVIRDICLSMTPSLEHIIRTRGSVDEGTGAAAGRMFQ